MTVDRSSAVAVAGLAALVGIAYGNSFGVPFQFDDFPAIVENPSIRSISDLTAVFDFQPTRFAAFYTFAINYAVHGLDVSGFHLVNVGIHLLAGIAMLSLTSRMLETPRINGSRWAAFLAAGWFVAHPLQTQAVTYIQQRSACMAGWLYLLALSLYLRSRASEGGYSTRWMALATTIAFVAMLTKENAFTLPFAVVLVEVVCYGRPDGGWPRWLARHAPLLATVAVIPVTTLTIGNLQASHMRILSGSSPLDYFVTQWTVLARYLRMTFWPAGQALDHGVVVHAGWPGLTDWTAAAVLLALSVAAWLARANRPLFASGVALFFLTHAVESSFLPLADPMFEQRMYLPMAGVALAIVAWIPTTGPARRPLLVVSFAMLVLLAALGHARNRVWQTPVGLWHEVVARNPAYARGWNALGNAYADAGRPDAAVEAFAEAVERSPDEVEYRYQLLSGALHAGRVEIARAQLPEIARLAPGQVIDAYGRGVFHEKLDQWDRAAAAFERALERTTAGDERIPRAAILGKLVFVYKEQGDYVRALAHLRRWIVEDPGDARLPGLMEALQRASDAAE